MTPNPGQGHGDNLLKSLVEMVGVTQTTLVVAMVDDSREDRNFEPSKPGPIAPPPKNWTE